MLKKITSVKDIQEIEKGYNIFDTPDVLLAKKYLVYKIIIDDLIVQHQDGIIETKLLTKKDLLSGNWWVRPRKT
jgi:hypothetical protein